MFNPVASGWFTDGFGMRYWADGSSDFHTGQDIAAGAGTPILAAHSGTISRKWWDAYPNGAGAGGNMVEIRGDDGYVSRYAHMVAQSPLGIGQRVVGGSTQIGAVGATGAATGNHLHYEVLAGGRYIDPKPLITGGGGGEPGGEEMSQIIEKLDTLIAFIAGPENIGTTELKWASKSGPQKAYYGHLEIDIYTQQLVAQTLSAVGVIRGQNEALMELVKQLAGGGGKIDMKALEEAAERGARDAIADLVLVPKVE